MSALRLRLWCLILVGFARVLKMENLEAKKGGSKDF